MEQELWAVDLDIGMSDMQSMCGLLEQVTGGSYSWKEGLLGQPGEAQGMVEEVQCVCCVFVCACGVVVQSYWCIPNLSSLCLDEVWGDEHSAASREPLPHSLLRILPPLPSTPHWV